MTALLGRGCCFPTLSQSARKDGTPFFVLRGVKAGLASARQTGPLRCGSFDCASLRLRFTTFRFVQDDGIVGEGLLLSHPFAKCAKGWGTLFRAAGCEGGPC